MRSNTFHRRHHHLPVHSLHFRKGFETNCWSYFHFHFLDSFHHQYSPSTSTVLFQIVVSPPFPFVFPFSSLNAPIHWERDHHQTHFPSFASSVLPGFSSNRIP